MSRASRHNWFAYIYMLRAKSARATMVLFEKPGVIAFLIVQNGRTGTKASCLLPLCSLVYRYEYSVRSLNVSPRAIWRRTRYVYFGILVALCALKRSARRLYVKNSFPSVFFFILIEHRDFYPHTHIQRI